MSLRLFHRLRHAACALPTLWARVALAQTAPEAAAALERVPDGAQVLHCGVARSVLYITYEQDGRAAIAPAFANAAIRKACAGAGHPLAAGPPGRTPQGPQIGVEQPGSRRAAKPPGRVVEPSFTVQASGSSLSIDGRNDSDQAFRCVINFAWTADGEPGGSRGESAQATLPARQSNRVVFITGPYRNMRFVGLPRWDCRPNG
jgi:hypothetical protein